MTTVEESETPSEEVPPGNPEELAKNPTALKGILIFKVLNDKFITKQLSDLC